MYRYVWLGHFDVHQNTTFYINYTLIKKKIINQPINRNCVGGDGSLLYAAAFTYLRGRGRWGRCPAPESSGLFHLKIPQLHSGTENPRPALRVIWKLTWDNRKHSPTCKASPDTYKVCRLSLDGPPSLPHPPTPRRDGCWSCSEQAQ